MNWDLTRLAVYIAGAGAALLSLLGYADFDPATGMMDPEPFNVYAVAAAAAGGISSLVAAVAWLLGWRGKK